MPSWIVEDPSTVLWGCAVVAAVFLALFIARRTLRPLLGAVGCGLVAAAVLLADFLVVTDREAIEGALERVERAIEREDVGAVLSVLAPEFRADGLDRAATEQVLRELARISDVERLRILVRQLDISADRSTATVRIDAIADGRYQGGEFSLYRTSWMLTFIRRGNHNWLMLRASPLEQTRIPRFRGGAAR